MLIVLLQIVVDNLAEVQRVFSARRWLDFAADAETNVDCQLLVQSQQQ